MENLTPEQQEKINNLLKDNDFIELLNDHLKANNLDEFAIQSIQFKVNSPIDTPCQPGYHPEKHLDIDGKYRIICVPNLL